MVYLKQLGQQFSLGSLRDYGTAVRDYIHVSGLSQAHLLAVKHLQNGGDSEFINLVNGLGFSFLEVIEAARKVIGKPIEAVIASRRAGDWSKLISDSAWSLFEN